MSYTKCSQIWFGTGGQIKNYLLIKDLEQLRQFLRLKKPFHIIGCGTNTLFRDHDFEQIIKLDLRGVSLLEENADAKVLDLTVDENNIAGDTLPNVRQTQSIEKQHTDIVIQKIYAEAGLQSWRLIRWCINNSVGGLEFMGTIPGTLGGLLKMNAGVYGRQMSDIVESVDVLHADGTMSRVTRDQIQYSYRKSNFPNNSVIIGAVLVGHAEKPEVIQASLRVMQQKRSASQPLHLKTLGSTFKNPPGQYAWQLLEGAGMRGFTVGGARFSNKHANFIENFDNATSEHVLELIDRAKNAVSEKFNIKLETEIVIV